MALGVAGSTPVIHPIFFFCKEMAMPDEVSAIFRFYYILGCRQVGKATDFDSVMRRFESCHPSHFLFLLRRVGADKLK